MTELPSPNTIDTRLTAPRTNEYTYKITIEQTPDGKQPHWALPTTDNVTPDDLLDHLHPDPQDILDTILEHTDLRTTIDGSTIAWITVHPDTGHITGILRSETYPDMYHGEPTVKVNETELLDDLRKLNATPTQ